jgi:hypothetical protein
MSEKQLTYELRKSHVTVLISISILRLSKVMRYASAKPGSKERPVTLGCCSRYLRIKKENSLLADCLNA